MRYSILSLLRQACSGDCGWGPAWREASPRPAYEVIVIGGGGHGLATANYLATVHGLTDVAVLEKACIGLGNAGRSTTIIRSNYLLPGNNPFYEFSMRLWEGLEQDLNYNAMVSQRGVLNLFHSDSQRDAYVRRGNAMRLHGVDAELPDRAAGERGVDIIQNCEVTGLLRIESQARRSMGSCSSRLGMPLRDSAMSFLASCEPAGSAEFPP